MQQSTQPKIELLVDEKALLGEGPSWSAKDQVLYWVNILEKKIYVYNPATQRNDTIVIKQHPGCVVPRQKTNSSVVIAGTDEVSSGFSFVDIETGKLNMIQNVESNIATNRFNDGKVDPCGRFWAGTMDKTEQAPSGSLYCLFPDLSVQKRESSITVSNGLTWSLDHKTMYYIDSPTKKVFAYDYNNLSGEISNKRVVFSINDNSFPDGMTIDAEGMLWVALWDGSSIIRFDPKNGKLLQKITFPVSRVTSCCWGGEHLDTLYVTTARVGLSSDKLKNEPLAGGLFAVKGLGVRGTPTFEFAA